MTFGKVTREKQKTVTMFEREVLVWVKEFESGLQRVGAFFVDRNRAYLTKQNMKLRVKVQELEEELSKKNENK